MVLAALPGIVRVLLATGKLVKPGNSRVTINFLGSRIRKVGLEKPIPLRVKDLPLGAVFEHVTKATIEPGDTGVPIDVDDAALAKARVTLATPVTYESKEGESLRVSLNTVLGRMNLRPRVEQGSLRISWTIYTLLDREPQTKLIEDRLAEKIDLSFEKTALEDVLKFIKTATRKGPDDKGIPIYVDPVGLLEAERTLATPVSFTTKGEPLKSSLERLLKTVGLTYHVKDGLLTVTSAPDELIHPVDAPKPKGARAPD
jgi:hypothetical protein